VSEFPSILIVEIDNVGSHHMQKIRQSLRGEAVLLMGKNTMIRRALRLHLKKDPKLEAILPLLRGNVGMVFTKGNLSAIRAKLLSQKVSAPAKTGAIAPADVIVPKGNTGMEPTKTSFLQALNIASKINKGQVEIINDVHLIKVGEKVGSSEATLLQMLNIKPFFYGIQVKTVYDNGSVYAAKVLDLTDDDILGHFRQGLSRVAALSLGLHLPSIAAFPHVVLNGYKNLLAVAIETDYSFKQADKVKDAIKNPGAAAVHHHAAPAAATKGHAASDQAEAAPVKDEEPEEDPMEGGMGGLFGDD